ncbi:MAG: glycosyltransferase family 4 protein [Candidatus Coatesbacteria bacterium]|nr:MAG: glycosyltransferase family 4 protein [Candidatus Coatesbacteria bacterium]
MRVAVYHNLPSGGAKRFLHDLMAALSPDVEFHLFVPASADRDFYPLTPYVASETVYPFKLKTVSDYVGPLWRPFDVERLRRLWRLAGRVARDIDAGGFGAVLVDHCRVEQSPSLLRFAKTPTVYYSQEVHRRLFEHPRLTRPDYGFRNRLGAFLNLPSDTLARGRDRKNAAAADCIVANSYHTREALIKTYGVFPEVIYPGVDLSRFPSTALPTGERDNAVLSVGVLAPFKGHRFILESLGEIPESVRPELRVVYNRDFPGESGYMETRAAELGVSLKLLPMLTEEGIVKEYQRCRLVALAQVVEPFGLVPLEAMACGTPVVAVKEGGFRETVADGVVGRLVDRDTEKFGEAVARLLTDDSLWAGMVANCRSYVEEGWTVEISAARFLEVFERAAKR